jgi:hypothetical protein
LENMLLLKNGEVGQVSVPLSDRKANVSL